MHPKLVTHADWSKNPEKRWDAIAVLDSHGLYEADAPECVEDLSTYFDRLDVPARRPCRTGRAPTVCV